MRPKLILIGEAWDPASGKDPRGEYSHVALRADDVEREYLHEAPLEQFIEAFYCDLCKKGFAPDAILKAARKKHL